MTLVVVILVDCKRGLKQPLRLINERNEHQPLKQLYVTEYHVSNACFIQNVSAEHGIGFFGGIFVFPQKAPGLLLDGLK